MFQCLVLERVKVKWGGLLHRGAAQAVVFWTLPTGAPGVARQPQGYFGGGAMGYFFQRGAAEPRFHPFSLLPVG